MPKYKSIIDVNDILNEYSDDVQEAIAEAAIKVAKQGVNELKATSPKRPKSGKYARGWRVKTERGKGYISNTIHNTQYQLTHLLEKGHRIVDRHGQLKGHVDARVHIAPVEQKCINQYTKDVEKIIKNGG